LNHEDRETMDDDVTEAEIKARILTQFAAKWGDKEAGRRVRLLEEVIPRVPEYAQLNNQRVDIRVHPEHLEFYISQLQPKVRAIIEHAGTKVLDKICDSFTTDERIAKIIRLVNMMDERAAASKAAEATDTPEGP